MGNPRVEVNWLRFFKYLAIMLLLTHLNEYFQRVSKSINVAGFNDTVSGLPGID